jgi:hypothetical protein
VLIIDCVVNSDTCGHGPDGDIAMSRGLSFWESQTLRHSLPQQHDILNKQAKVIYPARTGIPGGGYRNNNP